MNVGVSIFYPRPHSGAVWVSASNVDIWILLFQKESRARKGSASTDGSNKPGHFTPGLMPNLRTGRPIMRSPVCDVVELIRPKGVLRLMGNPVRNVDIIAGISVRLLRNRAKLSAHGSKSVDLFLRNILRHNNDRSVSAGISDQGQSNPGIAGGPFNDCSGRLKRPGLFRIQNDAERRAILHRSARIQKFGFPKNLASGRLRKRAQPDERCPTDRLTKSCGHKTM